MEMCEGPKISIVALKAYGDFVIACNAIRAAGGMQNDRCSVVAGEHLRELASALGVAETIDFLDAGPTVPAAFDLRRRGPVACAQSLWTLSRLFRKYPSDRVLVFDRIGWREKIIGGGHRCYALPAASNIYLAYAQLLSLPADEYFWPRKEAEAKRSFPSERDISDIVIFPCSRVPRKNLPVATIQWIYDALCARKLHSRVVLLEGEQCEIPKRVPLTIIPKAFSSLHEIIRQSRFVVSADSLPVHLAEFVGTPVFVVTPVPNQYWLPLSALWSRGWCLFDERSLFEVWLERLSCEKFCYYRSV